MQDKIIYYLFDYMPVMHRKLFKGISHKYTRHQMRLLHEVKEQGEKPMRHYGEKLMISKPNMSSLVARLEEDGLLERVHDKSDRRKIKIIISDNGKDVLKKQRNTYVEGVKKRLSQLSDDDIKELASAFETVERILEKIEE